MVEISRGFHLFYYGMVISNICCTVTKTLGNGKNIYIILIEMHIVFFASTRVVGIRLTELVKIIISQYLPVSLLLQDIHLLFSLNE